MSRAAKKGKETKSGRVWAAPAQHLEEHCISLCEAVAAEWPPVPVT